MITIQTTYSLNIPKYLYICVRLARLKQHKAQRFQLHEHTKTKSMSIICAANDHLYIMLSAFTNPTIPPPPYSPQRYASQEKYTEPHKCEYMEDNYGGAPRFPKQPAHTKQPSRGLNISPWPGQKRTPPPSMMLDSSFSHT